MQTQAHVPLFLASPALAEVLARRSLLNVCTITTRRMTTGTPNAVLQHSEQKREFEKKRDFSLSKCFIYLFFNFIALFMRDTETQAEGEAGPLQGARCGTRSQTGITPWAEGRRLVLSHPGVPEQVLCPFLVFSFLRSGNVYCKGLWFNQTVVLGPQM